MTRLIVSTKLKIGIIYLNLEFEFADNVDKKASLDTYKQNTYIPQLLL